MGSKFESSYPMFALASNRKIILTAYVVGWFTHVGFGVVFTIQNILVVRHTSRKLSTFHSDNYTESSNIEAALSGGILGFPINLIKAAFIKFHKGETLKIQLVYNPSKIELAVCFPSVKSGISEVLRIGHQQITGC